jgi:hypothetical protein
MLRLVTLLVCLITVCQQTAPLAQEEPTACDRLTAEGTAPADANAAVAACEAALAAEPGEPRIVYQYALALERAGRVGDALRMYRWAADDGHAPAQDALTRLGAVSGATERGYSEAERRRFSDALAAISNKLRLYANSLPRKQGDPLGIIADVGQDPVAILAWVSENTALVPYVGSLRGARGVLMDRAGNSLDRALALGLLMTSAGHDVRIARAQLTPAQAAALQMASKPVANPADIERLGREELIALFDDPRLSPGLAMAAVDEVLRRQRNADAILQQRTDQLLPILQALAAPFASAANSEQEVFASSAFADHFWVQVREGDGWRDFDPAGAVVGDQTATETFSPDAVPNSLRHEVIVRVVLELSYESHRREETLLTWSGYPADQPLHVLTLAHASSSAEAIAQLAKMTDAPERIVQALEQETTWAPMLRVGDNVFVERMFARDGKLENANVNVLTATGGEISSLFSGTEALLGGNAQDLQPPAIPTAEWLEVELRAPGAEPRIARRTIFNLLGPEARASEATHALTPEQIRDRALRLVGTTDALILGATPTRALAAFQSTIGLANNLDSIRAIVAGTSTLDVDSLSSPPSLAIRLFEFASERLADKGDIAISAPNVFFEHLQPTLQLTSFRVLNEFDIVFNEVSSAVASFEARLSQGIIDTILENAFSAENSLANTAMFHAEDLALGDEWQSIEPGDAVRLSDLPIAIRSGIEADLIRGYVVVAPPDLAAAAARSRLAWWRLDPNSGSTLGITASGGGGDTGPGYAHIIYHVVHKGGCALTALSVMIGHTENALVGAGAALCIAAGITGKVVGTALGIIGIAVHILELAGSPAEGSSGGTR